MSLGAFKRVVSQILVTKILRGINDQDIFWSRS
jgi:hypothetical protein